MVLCGHTLGSAESTGEGGAAVVSFRYGGVEGARHELVDRDDVVVVRTGRHGARHDVSPLSRRSRSVAAELTPLFGFAPAGVGVYAAPAGGAEELGAVLDEDPEVEFAGRGFRDRFGAPVVYTENLFVKFEDSMAPSQCEALLRRQGLSVKRALDYTTNGFFVEASERVGRVVFSLAEELIEREEVALCHPELVREISWKGAFPQQWHLQATEVDGQIVDAHAGVAAAWQVTEGAGVVIAVLDDGVDVDHEEFSSAGKVVSPHSFAVPYSSDPRPPEGAHHGTACSGVACADGRFGASGVAPGARLMPLRSSAALGSQGEADAFVWAADHGADVISCSWGPPDGRWWDPDDPGHLDEVPLPDATRLALDYAVDRGRSGRGCVIVWAAGNGNESVDNDGYASYEKVIAVAACNDTGTKSAYSDFGRAIWCAFPSNHGEPSLTSGIWTTDRTGAEGYNPGNGTLGDGAGNYTNSFGGTSSACPGVAGVAALVLARNPELRWDEVRDILASTGRRIDEAGGGYDDRGRSPLYGHGRVDAEAAVRAAGGEERS